MEKNALISKKLDAITALDEKILLRANAIGLSLGMDPVGIYRLYKDGTLKGEMLRRFKANLENGSFANIMQTIKKLEEERSVLVNELMEID